MKKTLVLFDFDGTISKHDVFIHFLVMQFGYVALLRRLAWELRFVLYYFLGQMEAGQLKEKLFSACFKGLELDVFNHLVKQYTDNDLGKYLYQDALAAIQNYKAADADIYVVSANIDLLLSEFCQQNQLNLIATKAEIIQNRISGKLASKNCNGNEKAIRILDDIQINDYEEIHVYGNSKGDLEMFKLGTKTFYKLFKK